MTARWYVLNVYSGSEKSVMRAINEKADRLGHADRIEEILIPTEEVIEVKRGQRVASERTFFPGYILIKADLNDDLWHMIKDLPRVTDFLGARGKPTPISNKEAQSLVQRMEEGAEKPRPTILFQIGEAVKVIDGPFNSFTGTVMDIDEDKHILSVEVSIFGRATPVELEYNQVSKEAAE